LGAFLFAAIKKPAEVRIQGRGVAGVVNSSIVQPAKFFNKFLTYDISCLFGQQHRNIPICCVLASIHLPF
jgi:hypothetical protein